MASTNSKTRKPVTDSRVKYTITITNARGKVIEDRQATRKSVRAVHRVAREMFASQPAGSHMTVKDEKGRIVMTWTMHKDGWTFEKGTPAGQHRMAS